MTEGREALVVYAHEQAIEQLSLDLAELDSPV